ncbi:MAG: MFS transporter [Leptolyngbyaceae cyanobacterium T60_A2020_046]|nr:MFS transporter [Leptolyngbyaceae cyanobacterium T60_A2020_046]
MFTLLTLLITSSMTVMAGAALAPDLPQIQIFFADVPRSAFWVKLMLTIPGLFTAIAAPFAGTIADCWGRKPLLLVSTFCYGVGGASGLVLSSIGGLLVGRALLGLSVGGIMTASTALIADYYHGPRRNQVMGIQASFMSFGGVVFLVLSGALADLGWRLPFLIYLTAFVAFGMAIAFITEPPRSQAAPDSPDSPEPSPMPQELLATLGGIYGLTFLSMATFYLVPVQLPFYLAELTQGQASNAATGIAIAALNLTSAVVATGYRRIRERLSFTAISGLGFGAMAVGYGVIAIAPTYTIVLLGLVIAGMTLGLNVPNLNVWLNAVAPATVRGRAVGGLTTCLFLGQFMSPILSQPVTDIVGTAATYAWFGGGLALLGAGLLGVPWLQHRILKS